MMCEMLFRGKRLDNGEWVEGYYISASCSAIEAVIIPVSSFAELNRNLRLELDEWWEVDPNTVCQFTGVADINGKKIFGGDIVKESGPLGTVQCTGTVQWSNLFSGWLVGNYRSLYGSNRVAKYEVLRSVFDDYDGWEEHDER